MTNNPSIGSYRREIDGLRALAVLPVILFHAGFDAFGGGYVGVDVFFVISGYLITSIILTEMQAGTFSLMNFYERRARRILPALFLVMAVCIPFAWFLLLPQGMMNFAESVGAVAVFLSNYLFYTESGYFDTAAELKPLLHTWSLAVEEQYYVLFPLFVLLTWRLGKKWMIAILAVAGILSIGYAHWAAFNKPAAAFFLLPARLWELAIGAFIAFYIFRYKRLSVCVMTSQIASLVGLFLILYAVFAFSKTTPFPSLYALVPTLGAALIILFATPNTVVGKILGTNAFVGIGLISYSAYLWHQPLFAFTRYMSFSEPTVPVLLALCFGTFLISVISWRYVETPFRRGQLLSRKGIFIVSIMCSLCFVFFGILGHTSNGFENRLNENQKSILVNSGGETRDDNGDCVFRINRLDEGVKQRFEACSMKYGEAIVIFGDSHAGNLFNALAYNTSDKFIFGLTKAGCRVHSPSDECDDDFKTFVETNKSNIRILLYNQAGFYLIEDENGNPGGREFFRRADKPIYQVNEVYIDKVASYLTNLSRSAPVTFVGPWVEPHLNADLLTKLAWECKVSDIAVDTNTVATFRGLDNYLKEFYSRSNDVRYLSSLDALNLKWDKDLFDCSGAYWKDSDHFSVHGAHKFGGRFADALGLNRVIH